MRVKFDQTEIEVDYYFCLPDGHTEHIVGEEEFQKFLSDPVGWAKGPRGTREQYLEYLEFMQNDYYGHPRCTAMTKSTGKRCQNLDYRVYVMSYEGWLDMDTPLCGTHRNAAA